MSHVRRCSRTACVRAAVMTLTYVYADQTAVVGPLAVHAEPHAYDLCDVHSERLSAPRGWEVLRLAPDRGAPGPSGDDLLALADAVREAAGPRDEGDQPLPGLAGVPGAGAGAGNAARETGRRGHLRVLRPE